MNILPKNFLLIFLVLCCYKSVVEATFTIAGTNSINKQVGGAGSTCIEVDDQSIFEAVYISVPGKAVLHSQALIHEEGSPVITIAREMMEQEVSPTEILEFITLPAVDKTVIPFDEITFIEGPSVRQYGLVDTSGNAAGYTGENLDKVYESMGHSSSVQRHEVGKVGNYTFSAQGNIVSKGTVPMLVSTFKKAINEEDEEKKCDDLAQRLMDSVSAVHDAGLGDVRCENGVGSIAFLHVDAPNGDTIINIDIRYDEENKDKDPVLELQSSFKKWRESNPCVSEEIYDNIIDNDTPSPISEDDSVIHQEDDITCSVCYEDGPGFDPTMEFIDDDGETSKCSEMALAITFLGQDPTLCSLLQLNNHLNCGCSTAPQGSSCPVCYEDGPGFDPTLEFVGNDGEVTKCSDLPAVMAFITDDPTLCTLLQLNNYLNCGCATTPQDSSCPVCYENGPGFDSTQEFNDDDGEIRKCSDVEATMSFIGEDDPTSCTFAQLNNHRNCGCITRPPINLNPTCPVCYGNGPGFDPTLEFVGDFDETTKCSDIELATVVADNPIACSQIQFSAHLFCGCSTFPEGGGKCDTGLDGRAFPNLDKVPPVGDFFAPSIIFDGSRTCGELVNYVSSFSSILPEEEINESLTPCEILVGYCAEGSTCDICPEGYGNLDNFVDEDSGFTCRDALSSFDDFVMSDETCSKITSLARSNNCCKARPIIDPTDNPVAAPTDPPVSSAPIVTPTNSPVLAPSNPPIGAPTDVPVVAPSDPPITTLTDAPVVALTDASVANSTDPPVTGSPVDVSTEPPAPSLTNSPFEDPAATTNSTSSADERVATYRKSFFFAIMSLIVLNFN